MRPITAGDLMNPEVLTVREDLSVRALARFLVDNEITGAPVEGVSGKLVGVVSLVDIASVASDSGNVESDQSNPDFFVRGWEDKIDLEEMIDFRVDNENLLVGEIMTPTVYSVPEDTTSCNARHRACSGALPIIASNSVSRFIITPSFCIPFE